MQEFKLQLRERKKEAVREKTNFGQGCSFSFSIGYEKTIWERKGMVNRADKNVS